MPKKGDGLHKLHNHKRDYKKSLQSVHHYAFLFYICENKKSMEAKTVKKMTRIYIVVSEELKKNLQSLADGERRSLSSFVNYILSDHVDKANNPQKPKKHG
jgi:hypothetical protein